MKFFFIVTSLLFIAAHAQAEPIPMGCVVMTYDCFPQPNGKQKCSWGYDLGYIYYVDLQKTGTSHNYEIWEGKLAGKARGHDYQISVYQRREAAKKVNYLTADLTVNETQISGQGQNMVEARYLLFPKNDGVGIHCSTDVSPAP